MPNININSLLNKLKSDKSNLLLEQYQILFGNNSGISMVCDAEGKFLFGNDKFSKLVGLTFEMLEGQTLEKILPQRKDREIISIQEKLNKNEIVNYETIISIKNNNQKYADIFLLPYSNNQTLEGIFVIINDKTEYKEMEQRFLQWKEMNTYAQQLAGIGFWSQNIQTEELYMDEGVYRLFEIDVVEFKDGTEFLTFIHPEDLDRFHQVRRETKQGIEHNIEFRIITKKGQQRHIHEKTKALFDNNHNIIKMIGIMQDVTRHKLIQLELKLFNEDLNNAQHISGIGSWKYNIESDILTWSEEIYRIYNVNPFNFKKDYESFIKLVHPEDRVRVNLALAACRKGNSYESEHRIPLSNGTIRYVIAKGEPTFNSMHQVVQLSGTVQDITDKKLLEIELNKMNNNLIQAQSLAHIGSWEMDLDNNQNLLTDEVYRIYGITPKDQEWTVSGFMKYIHPEDMDFVYDQLRNPPIGQAFGMEFRILRKDGEIRDVFQYLEIRTNKDGKVSHVRGTIQDITEKKELEKKIQQNVIEMNNMKFENQKMLEYLANHDEITKLSNRHCFEESLKAICDQAAISGNRFALYMIDTKGLRHIINALGYQLADLLSIEIADRIKNFILFNNHLFRYTNSIYTIIVTDLESIKEYNNFARELIELFNSSLKVDKYEMFLNVKIGISIFPEDGKDPNALINNANIALMKADSSIKSTYHFHTHSMDIENYKQFELHNDLRKAISNNQIKIYFQPIVELRTNEIIAAEALIRWEHPVWGLVQPNEFLSIANESGFIIELGKWILTEVCRNYKLWMSLKLPSIKVSVNYSELQLYENNFSENLVQVLDQFQLDPDFIILELDQSVIHNKSNKVFKEIHKLNSFGFHTALNELGVGFSSLTYLHELNFEILKIDQTIVRSISTDQINSLVTSSLLNLCNDLRLKVVAVGIENWDQLQCLRRLNCFAGQGYLFSKPIPAEEFLKLLPRKLCKPVMLNNAKDAPFVERRNYFRVQFTYLLEATMEIIEISGKTIQIDSTKVVIKNMGPGGICFLSNINLPIKRDIIISFTTNLMKKKIKVFGCPVWGSESDYHLYEYGLEFTFDENARVAITSILNQFQIKMHNNRGFIDGDFITTSANKYFNSLNKV